MKTSLHAHPNYAKCIALCLDRVLALEHVVDLLEVVGTRGDGRDLALGGVVLLEMGLLAQVTHLYTMVSKDKKSCVEEVSELTES